MMDTPAFRGEEGAENSALRCDERRRLAPIQHAQLCCIPVVPRPAPALLCRGDASSQDDRPPSRWLVLRCTRWHDGEARRPVQVREKVGVDWPLDEHPGRRNKHTQPGILYRELLLDPPGLDSDGKRELHTKAFPGRHGVDEIEPWLRQVLYFALLYFLEKVQNYLLLVAQQQQQRLFLNWNSGKLDICLS